MIIRKIKISDLAACESIYTSAREYMKNSGNPNQWNGIYPGTVEILSDIANGTGYVCEDDQTGEVLAVFHFSEGPDPTYNKIYQGEWKSDEPYAVIHRIAVKYHGMGVIDFCFSECFAAAPHLRIDTHRDNIPMQRVLSRNGFEYCGIIYLESGDERLAFEKTK
jgi:RimJ/RimL family protein N-acetyltransferase